MEISAADSRADFGGTADRRETSRFPVRRTSDTVCSMPKGCQAVESGRPGHRSGGILFTTQERLPLGRLVEVAVNWPVRLGGACPLQFVAVGKVVRSEATKAAVQIMRYEFKTRAVTEWPLRRELAFYEPTTPASGLLTEA